MSRLSGPTRRGFGRGAGAALALLGLPRRLRADAGPQAAEVRIARFAFDPAHLRIRAGDSVTWSNADLAPHTATAADGAWDTGALARGERGRIAFDAPGQHAYACAFHPQMRGTVIVLPRSGG